MTQLSDLIVYIWAYISNDYVADFIRDCIHGTFITCILLFYLYQMRIVQFKLESEDHASYKKLLIKSKIKWIFLSTLTFTAMGLFISWFIIVYYSEMYR